MVVCVVVSVKMNMLHANVKNQIENQTNISVNRKVAMSNHINCQCRLIYGSLS